jgi:ankyrin repeat protein
MKRIKLAWLALALMCLGDGGQNKADRSLHQAAADSDIEQVKSLISNGGDVNAKDNQVRTPLQHAQDTGHAEIVELLKKHAATE